MQRSTDRILTTHTGSLPRTAKVVELLLDEQENPGARKAEFTAAVREAITHVVGKQIESGIDIINDGEQGRTDYTVHVLDRLTGYAGERVRVGGIVLSPRHDDPGAVALLLRGPATAPVVVIVIDCERVDKHRGWELAA